MDEFRFSPHPNKAHLIRWRPWGGDAFQEAKEKEKPVFLSISAIWCHWCHVMDETSLSSDEVIQLLNTHYIPVRVDNDRRPDINNRYNMGGWPTIAILTANGDTITGGTYLPPRNLKELLLQVKEAYAHHKAEIHLRIAQLLSAHKVPAPPSEGRVTRGILESLSSDLREAYDEMLGGFGSEPKFPLSECLDYLLAVHGNSPPWIEMVIRTLTLMASSSMYDHEEGGFFRYSVTRDWNTPHYEKMLETNLSLLRNYLHGFQVTRGEQFKTTAQGIVRYLNDTLYNAEEGWFAGSQDADEEYYKLPLSERKRRPAPFVDRTCYTSWNALGVIAYLEASVVLEYPLLQSHAIRTLDYLLSHLVREGTVYHYFSDKPEVQGLLEDHLWLGKALLVAYQYTGREEYFREGSSVLEGIVRQFRDLDGGGFWDIIQDESPQGPEAAGSGRLRLRDKSIVENAIAADLFLDYSSMTGDQSCRRIADEAVRTFLDLYRRFSMMAAGYGKAVARLLTDEDRVYLVGDPQDPARILEMRKFLSSYRPFYTLRWCKPGEEGAPSQPGLYLCRDQTCQVYS